MLDSRSGQLVRSRQRHNTDVTVVTRVTSVTLPSHCSALLSQHYTCALWSVKQSTRRIEEHISTGHQLPFRDVV